MPTLTKKKTTAVVIRNLPIDVHDGLKRRARERGTSTEAEIRSILLAAVRSEIQIRPGDVLLAFGKKYGPLPLVKDRTPVEPIVFE